MAKNTYKQDEVLEEPFDIRHLLRASSYIKKYAGRMVVAILLSGIGGAFGYVAPMIKPVSYTHLTLPTVYPVSISVAPVSLTTKTIV